MSKKDFKSALKKIPEAIAPEINVVENLKKLQSESSKENTDKKIKLSFEFLDTDNELFRLGEIENEWYPELLNEFKMLTDITKKQVFGEYKKKYQPHPYTEIEKLNYKDKYLTNPQYDAIQLRLSKSTGRLHGFFVDNIYYIRFLDRWHNMYNSKGYPVAQICSFPLTIEERLTLQIGEKNLEINELKEKMNKNGELICDNCLDCPKEVYKKFEL